MKRNNSLWYLGVLLTGIAAIMIIAPFYAPVSVLLASHLQHFDFWKIWKEIALSSLGVILVGFMLTHRQFTRQVLRTRLAVAIALYIALLVFTGVYDLLAHRVSDKAVIYGWLVDIRPLGFFVLSFLAFSIAMQKKMGNFPWRKIILVPAFIVIVFGFLQMTILPKDILTHIGYNKSTIAPYQTIDNQPGIVRIESSLRGPNPLGAYLVLIITMLAMLFFTDKKQRRWLWGLYAVLALVVLFGTYSRSAELGLVLSLLCLLAVAEHKFIARHLVVVGAIGVLVIAGGLLFAQRSYTVQNILFHSSNESTSTASSNAQRLDALKSGVKDIVHQPLGGGVGSAGPASLRNSKRPGRIAENYFLQIGQEVGILGMILFVSITVLVARGLWLRRNDPLARILLASLVGLTFVNLLSHAWTDDTLAYIWWGLAGIALAPAILEHKRKQSGKAWLSKAS